VSSPGAREIRCLAEAAHSSPCASIAIASRRSPASPVSQKLQVPCASRRPIFDPFAATIAPEIGSVATAVASPYGQPGTGANGVCDDPRKSPGMGIVLLRAAIGAARFAMSLGGNELTRSLLPRIAAQTIADAGAVYVLPLRLGYVLEKVDRRLQSRVPGAPALARTLLGSLPLPAMRRRDAGIDIQPGVAPRLEHALARHPQPTPAPAYDLEYVQWQCGRCPEIDSWTVLDGRDVAASAAAVVFRARSAPGHWRMVWWEPAAGAAAAGANVLRAASAFARAQGARSLSAIVSRADERAASRLRAEGFMLQRGGQPLYVNPSDRAAFVPFDRVGSLSYLDTDLAHLP